MKPSRISIALLVLFLPIAPSLFAQSSDSSNQSTASFAAASAAEVPHLIKFSGTLLDERGHAMPGPVGMTFALYAQQAGGAALWLETQNVKPDANGDYIVLLGANSAKGVPAELFASGEARWLGVQPERQIEQPRVLLVSVPYALKAGDAETLGGKPASAFALSGSLAGSAGNTSVSQTIVAPVVAATAPGPSADSASVASGGVAAASACAAITADGTAPVNQLAKFSGPCQLHQSLLSDNGTTVSVAGAFNLPAVAAATSTLGKNSFSANFAASSFSSSTHLPVNQLFRWQAEPVGNNTATPSGKLNLLYAAGTGTPGETGLSINNRGLITFASGQTLPAITGNESVAGNVSANQLQSNVVTGTAPFVVKSTTQVANLNASFLDGLSASAFASIGPNTFAGNQVIPGNGLNVLIGNVGCGSPTAGIGAAPVNCNTFALGMDGALNSTFINRPTGGSIQFREGNGADQMTILPGGQVRINNGNGTGAALVVSSPAGKGAIFQGGNYSSGFGFDGVEAEGGNAFSGQTGGNGITAYAGQGSYPNYSAGFAGDFEGDVQINGALFAGTKNFKIDHPLDPANKYLFHASVESLEMMDIYTGNVILDGNGEAVVQFPAWFEALNRDFRYQLTAVGKPAYGLYIGREVSNNTFQIAGGSLGLKVSWQITALRQDAYARAHPLQPEVEKSERERGFYIHPELYGQPEEKQMEWGRNPQLMKQRKEMREKQQANLAGSAKP